MAKYECKVCGYIYNEQHAGRPFEELTECPICNEGKENFFAHGGEDAEQPKVAEPVVDVSEDDDFIFEEIKDDVAEVVAEAEETAVASDVEDIASDVEDIAETPEFVVERRQDFWTPVGAKPVEKDEAPVNNTTGWTISNAHGAVEKVLGEEAEEVASDLEDTILEEEDVPAYASRIESFYSNAEAVGTSHIISGEEEEEEPFKPLWNSSGGTVQRVIDPFGDRNDSVVKAENVGMVMPAEEPVAEEPFAFFDDDEDEHVANPEAEADVFKAIDSIVFEDDVPEGGRVVLVTPDGVEEIPLADEEEVAEAVEEAVEEAAEAVVEESAPEIEVTEEIADEVIEEEEVVEAVSEELPALDDDDDFVFEEYTMPASGDVFGEVKEEVVFEDAEAVAEEIIEEVEPVVELTEEPVEALAEEEEEAFVFEGFDETPVAEEIVAEAVEEIAEETVDEEAVEDTAEEVVEAAEEVAVEAEEAVEGLENAELEEVSDEVEEVVEELVVEVQEEVTEEPAVEIDDAIDEIAEADEDDFAFDEVTEEAVAAEEPVVESAVEEKKEDTPIIKAWSFLDDVVEAGAVAGGAAAVAGGAVAGVTFVSKAMDEVVEEEVTEDDIEEVFVNFADDRKVGVHNYDANASLASELFEEEDSIMDEIFKEEEPETEEKVSYCNNLEKILIVPAQLNPMPLPEGTQVEGRTVLGITSEKPLVLDDPVFSTGDYNMVQYIPNSGLTSEDYQKADAIEIIVGHGNGIEKTINSKEDLRQVVNFLRLESDGCPIGIKMAASRIERDLEFCVFAKPDYVVLNNFDVVPLPYALHRATKFLNTVQSGMDIVIALDGAKDAEELAKIMAMGADVIALRNRPDDMIKMTEGLKKYARITGHYDVEDLNVKDLCTTDREIAEYTDIYHV